MADLRVIACDKREAFAQGALAMKQSIFLADDMDCFAEPVIGRRYAPTRWLAMTAKGISQPLSCIAKNAGSMARDLLNC